MPGLFDNLWGEQHASTSSALFSASSKFAAAGPASRSGGAQQGGVESEQPASPAAPAAAAPAGGGGGSGKKKRRKQEPEGQQQAVPAAAASAPSGEAGEHQSKKQRKDKGQRDQQATAAAAAAQATQPAEATGKKGGKAGKAAKAGSKGAATAEAATANAAAAAAAADPAEQPKQAKKPKKKKSGAADTAGAAAAAALAAAVGEQAAAAASKGGKPGEDDKDKEDERLPRTVFVGNLPATVKRKSLVRLFTPCGAVESVRLRSLPLKQEDPESKAAKIPRRGQIAAGKIDTDHSAHAYVVFVEEAAVEAALKLNMKQFEGHHVRVDRAAPKAAKGAVQFDPVRSIFVGNLPHDAEDEQLIRLFGTGNVEAVRVVRDGRTGAGKGVAFVLLRTQEASKAALRAHKHAVLGGRALRLTVVNKEGKGGGKAKPEAWQQGKSSSGGKEGDKASGPAKKKKSGGKRPAVAARKQGDRLKARAARVQKR